MNIITGKQRIYFVGIKGIAMAALAIVAKERGLLVSGSDVPDIFPSDNELTEAGIAINTGFLPENIDMFMPDIVIYTGAHGGRENPEVCRALEKNIPAIAHGQALGYFMDDYRQVSVAGCHGKTTTSAMISTIARLSGIDSSYAVGCGKIIGLGPAGHAGKGRWFISEADEYITDPGHDRTPRFMWQKPSILVLTNIDFDHPDAYRNLADVKKSYLALVRKMPAGGVKIISADDRNSRFLRKIPGIITVGTVINCDYRVTDIRMQKERTDFSISERGMGKIGFIVSVPGKHNAINAAMAAVAANRMGITWEKIRSGLAAYSGASRRFEQIGRKKDIMFYDDYAHHPAEITATLSTAKLIYPEHRIIAVFQPHTYSRTKSLMPEFSRAFKDADLVIISELYASARETHRNGYGGNILADLINRNGTNTMYRKTPEEIEVLLKDKLRKSDIVIFMGAGDIFNWARRITENLVSG